GFGVVFTQETEQMKAELPKQPKRDKNACDVGDQPAWVTNDLKDRVIRGFVHLILIKSFARMTKWGVHINKSFSG
mgnify:CR=1